MVAPDATRTLSNQADNWWSQRRIDAMRVKMGVPSRRAAAPNYFNMAMGNFGSTTPTDPTAAARTAIYGPLEQAAEGMGSSALGIKPEEAGAAGVTARATGGVLGAGVVGVGAALGAYDTGVRAVNTAVAGTTLLGGAALASRDRGISPNPLTRDGWQPSDVWDTYRMAWGEEVDVLDAQGNQVLGEDGKPLRQLNAITAGQAIALTVGRTYLNMIDVVVPGDVQAKVNEKILEDTQRAFEDPSNSRGLYSWMIGLYSDFDVSNYEQRESAFNQGLGRWISGATDAAVQWWLAPEVIGLKVAGKASRSLLTQSFDSMADINKAVTHLDEHKLWLDSGGQQGKKHAIGKLVESFVRMDEKTLSKHKIATSSTDPSLVARALGRATTYDEAATTLRAMLGDQQAIQQVIDRDRIVGDTMRLAREEIDTLDAQLSFWERPGNGTFMGVDMVTPTRERIEELQLVLDDAVAENVQLSQAIGLVNKEAAMADRTMIRRLDVSRIDYGPNAVGRMERQAEKSLARTYGSNQWGYKEFKTGGKFGRTVRLWQSTRDYMKTQRINGLARLDDSGDTLAEFEASVMTTPMIRKLTRMGPDTMMPGTDMTVTQFRQKYYDALVSAPHARVRAQIMAEYEADMWRAMSIYYEIDPQLAKGIVARYTSLKTGLNDQIASKGWFEDSGTINVVPELQALIASRHSTMDFNFLERIFRLERGSAATRARIGSGNVMSWADSIWRPLVLMRLGYTQRNVAEGWLRELAMYGSLGGLVDRNMTTRGLSGGDKAILRWANGIARRSEAVKNVTVGTVKYGRLKKIRRELDAAAKKATDASREAKALEDEAAILRGKVTQYWEYLNKQARELETTQFRQQMDQFASVTWEEVSDLMRGRITDIMDSADMILIAPTHLRPLQSAISGYRYQNLAIGRTTANDTLMDTVNAPDGQVIDLEFGASLFEPDASGAMKFSEVRKNLPPSMRDEFDGLAAKYEKQGFDEADAARYEELQNEAVLFASRRAIRQGDKAVRAMSPGQYQIVHNLMDITAEDLASGNVMLLPKDAIENVTHIRSQVAGGTIDLRAPVQETQAQLDMIRAGQDEDDLVLAALFDFNSLPDSYFDDGGSVFDFAETLLEASAADPRIATALSLKIWARSLPREMREWLENQNLLIPNRELKRLRENYAKVQEKYTNAEQRRIAFKQEIEDEMAREEFWDGYPELQDLEVIGKHGGLKIKGDEIKAIRMTEQALQGFVGPGFYTTGDSMVGGSYMVTKAIDNAMENGGKPTYYVVMADPSVKRRFLDLEERVDSQETEEFVLDLGQDFFNRLGIDIDLAGDGAADLDAVLLEAFQNTAFPIDPFSAPGQWDATVQEYMRSFITMAEQRLGADARQDPQIWQAWMDTVTGSGAVGIKHQGGNNWQTFGADRQHEVFVWYDPSQMELVPLDELSKKGQDLLRVSRKARKLMLERDEVGSNVDRLNASAPYEPRLVDGASLSEAKQNLISTYMARNGIGKTIIQDSSAPSGTRVIVNPDYMSITSDSVDNVLPGTMKGKDYTDRLVVEQKRLAAAENEAIWTPSTMSDNDILAAFGNDFAVKDYLRGVTQGTPEVKAKVVRYMEVEGYSHVQVGGTQSNLFRSAAELVGNRQTGTAYGAALGADAVQQRAQLIGASDPTWTKMLDDLQQLEASVAGKAEHADNLQQQAMAVADRLKGRMGSRRSSGMQIKPKLGTGEERFQVGSEELTVDAPFEDALYMALSGADDRVTTELFGYTDFQHRNIVRTSQPYRYVPGDSFYFQEMATQANRLWRRDPIGISLAQGKTDEEIFDMLFSTKQGRAHLRDSEDFKAFDGFVSRDTLNEGMREDVLEEIARQREIFERTFPDAEVRSVMAQGDVTPDFLRSRLAWRDDLGDLEGLGVAYRQRGVYRRATGNIMHVLGTMPENALVRHPFFRARWREEMQRQLNLYQQQGVTDFGPDAVNAMSQVAKKYALQATNDTLYTITRLSTPAWVFRFVVPFFPAWASAMKFWLRRLPAEHPENIARYAMAFNAPESAGFMYDDQGNKIQPREGLANRILGKVSGVDDGSIVIQMNENVAKRFSSITGGQSTLRVGKGTLDVMLQGEYFWAPGLGPLVTFPASWLMAQMPDIAEALESGRITEGIGAIPDIPEIDDFIEKHELTKALYRQAVPFGRPTSEKDILDAAIDVTAPAWMSRLVNLARGTEDSPEFANAVNGIYRDMLTDWELGGREGPEPDYMEAISNGRKFFVFRSLVNLTAPFAPGFQSKYQFYIDEWRRMQSQIGVDGYTYQTAQDEFLSMYGPTFFRYTKSLSGSSSGISATVGEFEAVQSDPQLTAELARIGPDASFVTMFSRRFATPGEEGFSDAVYAYQTDRAIEGAPGKFMRGGPRPGGGTPDDDADRDLGWYYFNKYEEQYGALLAQSGKSQYDDVPELDAERKNTIQQLAAQYPAWFDDYEDIGGNRWVQSNTALNAILDSKTFEKNKNDSYFSTLALFRDYRNAYVQILQERDAAGGSDSLTAKANADIAVAWEQTVQELIAADPSGAFGETFRRFFRNDPLQPIPEG